MAKKKNLTRNLLIAGGVILVILIVARKAGWIGEGDETKVTVEKATKQAIIETVSASGKVQPETEVKLSADVSGEVVELYVKEGDMVKKGDPLAKINPEIYLSSLDRMIAAVNSAKANLENARSRLRQTEAQFMKAELDYKRNQKLFKEGVIAASEFEAIQSSFEVARAEVDAIRQSVAAAEFNVRSAEASLKEARENLNKTSIFAPVSGTVSKLSVEQGERVVGTELMAGTEVLRIADLNEMEVNVDVSENDIIRVHLGDTATVDIDAYADRNFRGIVTEIANSANLEVALGTDQVTNFTVKVRILRTSYDDLIPENKPSYSPFRPGMSATVEIQTNKAFNVLSVPIQAVTTRDTAVRKSSRVSTRDRGEPQPGDESAAEKSVGADKKGVTEIVFVHENGKVTQRTVETGIQDNFNIHILSGLKEGEEVVTGPYNAVSRTLKTGDQVKVMKREDLFAKEREK